MRRSFLTAVVTITPLFVAPGLTLFLVLTRPTIAYYYDVFRLVPMQDFNRNLSDLMLNTFNKLSSIICDKLYDYNIRRKHVGQNVYPTKYSNTSKKKILSLIGYFINIILYTFNKMINKMLESNFYKCNWFQSLVVLSHKRQFPTRTVCTLQLLFSLRNTKFIFCYVI